MANNQNLIPFVKGDKRINRKGRPKNFDMARSLAQQIAHEVLTTEGKGMINPKGDLMTRIEAILRTWSSSRDFRAQEAFMAYAVGKPKEQIDLTSAGDKIVVRLVTDETS